MTAAGKSLLLIKDAVSVAIEIEAEKSEAMAGAIWDAIGRLERVEWGATGGDRAIDSIKNNLIDAVGRYMLGYKEEC